MKRMRIVGVIAVLALIVAACGSGTAATTTQAPDTIGGPPITPSGPLSDYGESDQADAALISRALGPVTPSDDASWNLILASVARAHQDLNEATISKALECFNSTECDTGSGGELVMGYADGGGPGVNVWRAVSTMEAILQALTYPEIGKIIFRAANFDADSAVHVNDIEFLIDRGVDFIVGYPDVGVALSDVIKKANAEGIPYLSFSAGWVGLPDQENALVPGTDYLTVVGEDLCALGESFAEVLNEGVGEGKIALLGGTPNNALSLGWQRCVIDNIDDDLQLVNPPPNRDTTAGDTFWYAPAITGVFQGLLASDPDIKGWAYEYADGMHIGLAEFAALNIPVVNQTMALRTDEQNLFCAWVEANEPTWKISYSAGGNFQSRVAVTAAMVHQKGGTIPATVTVPHVMRDVTAADCNPNRANAEASGTSLVPDSVMRRMFSGN